jgi:hypothetical protein
LPFKILGSRELPILGENCLMRKEARLLGASELPRLAGRWRGNCQALAPEIQLLAIRFFPKKIAPARPGRPDAEASPRS